MFIILIGILFLALVYMYMMGLFTISESEKTYDVMPQISNFNIKISK